MLGLCSRHTKAKYFGVRPNLSQFFRCIHFNADGPFAGDHLNLGLEVRICTIQCNRNSNFLNQGLYDCYQKMNEPLSSLKCRWQNLFSPLFWIIRLHILSKTSDCIIYPKHQIAYFIQNIRLHIYPHLKLSSYEFGLKKKKIKKEQHPGILPPEVGQDIFM